MHKFEKSGITGMFCFWNFESPSISWYVKYMYVQNSSQKLWDWMSYLVLDDTSNGKARESTLMLANTPFKCTTFCRWSSNFILVKRRIPRTTKVARKVLSWLSLEINTEKAKVITFNDQGALLKKFKFYYDNLFYTVHFYTVWKRPRGYW